MKGCRAASEELDPPLLVSRTDAMWDTVQALQVIQQVKVLAESQIDSYFFGHFPERGWRLEYCSSA